MAAITRPDDDLATAYHEAGHAVVALAYGLPVARVTICDSPELTRAKGYMAESRFPLTLAEADALCLDRPDAELLASPLLGRLLTALAGGQAERRIRGCRPEVALDSDFRDRMGVEQTIGALLGHPAHSPTVCRMEAALAQAAAREVARHWEWIDRTAAALVARRTMTGDDVLALQGEAQ